MLLKDEAIFRHNILELEGLWELVQASHFWIKELWDQRSSWLRYRACWEPN